MLNIRPTNTHPGLRTQLARGYRPVVTPVIQRVELATLVNQIHCMKAEELLAKLPDGCIDMILTSPPYDNLRTYEGFSWNFEQIAREAYRVLKPGGVMVWVVGDATVNGSETLTSFKQALYFRQVGFNLHDTMIYQKDGAAFPDTVRYGAVFEYMFVLSKGTPRVANLLKQPNKQAGVKITKTNRRADGITELGHGERVGKRYNEMGVLPNVWLVSVGYNKTTKDKEAYKHPAMFPEKLADRHILTWSNSGDTVLDFFMGSGTTAKMARNNGRNYIGCDISQDYVDLANKRLAQPYTPPMFTDHTPGESPAPAQVSMFEGAEK